MTDLQVKKLYIKFFDVTWDAQLQRPSPAAHLSMESQSLEWIKQNGIEVVPVVFITNETLDKILPETTSKLGERIDFLLRDLVTKYGLMNIREVQLDCDWTAGTREKYFDLLRYLKTLPFYMERQLSATIRLYQCKYQDKTGIPPVNRGLLMCYNMGNLKDPATGNSIIEANELKKYTDNLSSYPLPLDIAMPLFEWKVLFRQNVYTGLIQQLPDSLLLNQHWVKANGNRYQVLADTIVGGYEFKNGDLLRNEKSEVAEIKKAIGILSPQLRTTSFAVSLYHLDSTTLSKYQKDEIENIYRGFAQ